MRYKSRMSGTPLTLATAAIFIALSLPNSVSALDPTILKNDINLRDNKILMRPLTVMEYMLVRLNEEAQKKSDYLKVSESDSGYHLAPRLSPHGFADFDPGTGRIVLSQEVEVDMIDDPWEDVCTKSLSDFMEWLFPSKERMGEIRLNWVYNNYFRPGTLTSREEVGDVLDALDRSLVGRMQFTVIKDGHWKYIRTCYLDRNNGKSYFEEIENEREVPQGGR